ncbi:PE-PPE domain-containing protein [Mycobacterium sp. M26]|uniref:PE-PPE domain-containing protein n=1 Tax=Mycobacterium sp. M26 TaxID=1762962 RepID=UPI00073E1915|nr:PE-PPE domain-containing protein [Mycobacterium sp. M26]
MRNFRRLAAVLLALFSAVVLGVASIFTSAVTLAATTALIVPGTGTPDADAVTNFKTNVQTYYLGDTSCTAPSCVLTGIPYPASLWPLVGGLTAPKWDQSVATGVGHLNSALINTLDSTTDPIVIFGFSQGAAVVSNEITNLLTLDSSIKNRLQVVVAGNPDRPNGGIWTRLGPLSYIPILDVETGDATPTDTGFPVTDIAFEYDPVGDAPAYPLNLLATVNAVMGLIFIHTTYIAPNSKTSPTALPDGYTAAELAAQLDPAQHPENFKYYNDTTYVTIPTKILPIMQPLVLLGAATGLGRITTPIVDLLSPALRVLIDTGYDRTTNPGVYTPFRLIPRVNPLEVAVDFVNAVGQGINQAIEDIKTGATVPAGAAAPAAATPLRSVASSVRASAAAATPRSASAVRKPLSASSTKSGGAAGAADTTTSSPSGRHESVGHSARNAA